MNDKLDINEILETVPRAGSLPVTHDLLVGKEIGSVLTPEEFAALVGECGERRAEKGTGHIVLETKRVGKFQGHGHMRVTLEETENGFEIKNMYVGSLG